MSLTSPFSLDEDDIKDAFNKAKDQGKDYLLKVSYVLSGLPLAAPVPVAVGISRVIEQTYAFNAETLEDDLLALYKHNGSLHIHGVYDLSGDFNASAKGTTDILPQDKYEAALKKIEAYKTERAEAMAARPLWKKILGLDP